jgi:hypothetical protein
MRSAGTNPLANTQKGNSELELSCWVSIKTRPLAPKITPMTPTHTAMSSRRLIFFLAMAQPSTAGVAVATESKVFG